MKKAKFVVLFNMILIFVLYFTSFNTVSAAENTDYTTFPEIIMTTGKLLKNFTKEEQTECLKNVEGFHFWGINLYYENSNVPATYISNTIFSVDNASASDMTYNVEVEVETNTKISFKLSGEISAKFNIPVDKIKSEVGAKTGYEISVQTQMSKKEKRTMKLIVEGGSRAIMYLTGEVTVTNGAISYYSFFINRGEGCFEMVALNNQYTRIEKTKI